MSHPLGPTGVVELAILSRSGLDESRHLGAAVVVSPDGTIARSLGDADALVYGRSSLKFFQAIAVLRSGVSLAGAQLVLATASHSGTAAHVHIVRSLLARAGLGEDALQCPLDWPLDSASRSAASAPARVTMNCSGKHAAFLLACVENGWPSASYLAPEHPLQQLIRDTVEEFTGEPIGQVGVDGCGAPVFATTLRGLAIAVGRVSAARDASAVLLAAALAQLKGGDGIVGLRIETEGLDGNRSTIRVTLPVKAASQTTPTTSSVPGQRNTPTYRHALTFIVDSSNDVNRPAVRQ